MTRASLAALVAAAGLALVSGAAAQRRPVSITVVDRLGTGQQEETIAVYLGGVLRGTLHVDADHPQDSFTVEVPAADRIPFALCGRLLRVGAGAAVPIDNGGLLTDYAGQVWSAVTLGDKAFTLHSENGAGRDEVAAGPACTAAVS